MGGEARAEAEFSGAARAEAVEAGVPQKVRQPLRPRPSEAPATRQRLRRVLALICINPLDNWPCSPSSPIGAESLGLMGLRWCMGARYASTAALEP